MKRRPAHFLRDYLRFAEAWLALSVAAGMIALLPFRMVVRTASWGRAIGGREDATEEACLSLVAIHRAVRRNPLRLVCIQQSLALQWMLRRRGYPTKLHYGVRSESGEISAHVWVSLGDRILIGEAEADAHACVATFPARPV